MKNKILKYFVSALIISLFGCEKEVPVPNELKSDPELVLYAELIANNGNIEFSLNKSKPIFNSENADTSAPIITKVILSKNGIPIDYTNYLTNINSSNGSYKIDLNGVTVIPGEKYKLEVFTATNKSIYGETIIPSYAPNEAKLTINNTSANLDDLTYKLQFQDKIGVSNYYQTAYLSPNFHLETLLKNTELISDFNVDGKLISSNNSVISYDDTNNNYNEYKFYINALDFHQYKYLKTLYNYEGDNPYAEPQNLYSNVTGGLGCVFSSYYKEIVVK